jgi:hypothetical protein
MLELNQSQSRRAHAQQFLRSGFARGSKFW